MRIVRLFLGTCSRYHTQFAYLFQKKHETMSHPLNAWNIGSARHLSSPIAAHSLCQCQKPTTVHLVMRSVEQTRTQPTQQHHCSLCGSEYYYMYWLHKLRGPLCDGLPPRVNKVLVLPCPLVADKLHPCLECRWLACQVRSWRFLCSDTRTALSCSRWFWETLPNFSELHYWVHSATNSFPSHVPRLRFQGIWHVVFPHNVDSLQVLYPADALSTEGRNTSWAYSRKVLAAAGFSMCTMAGPSNTTTSTLGVMSSCSSMASSRHRTMSDLVPSLSLPPFDSDVGHGLVGLVGTLQNRVLSAGSCERKIHRGYHHETEMQHTISRTGCDHFSAMNEACTTDGLATVTERAKACARKWENIVWRTQMKNNSFGPLTLVWCIEQVYIVLLHNIIYSYRSLD